MTLKFDAAVFDMDGTLIDSMPTWRRMNRGIFEYFGCKVPEELEDTIESVSSRFIAKYMNEHGICSLTRDELILIYEQLMRKPYLTEIKAKEGALEYLAKLKNEGKRLAVYTSTTASVAEEALRKQGMTEYFDFVTDVHIIGYEKSVADGYIKVAEMLGTGPEDCVMFEDSPYAMKGARLAGYKVIGIRDMNNEIEPNRTEARALCDLFADTFCELP